MSKARSTVNVFLTLGGRVQCVQCQAKSKRTGQQCRAPAIQGHHVCRFHGGLSTGPRTQEGRKLCAQARTVHGEQTTAARLNRRHASARLATLEAIGQAIGMLAGAKKTPGRRPGTANVACPELKEILDWLGSGST